MKAYLTRRYMFSASHRLHSDRLSHKENAETFGKCNNPYGHGHNYFLEVTVSGAVDSTTGMICHLVDVDNCVHKVLERFDHQNLNALPEFVSNVPSTENVCILIYEVLQRQFHAAHLEKVRIEETMMNSFEYAGDAELKH